MSNDACRKASLTGQLKREVQTRQHDSREYPPPKNTRDEGAGATSNLQSTRQRDVAVVELQVGTCEQGEDEHEGEEDHEEAHVCADGADEVDEAHEAHGDEEEGWAWSIRCLPLA